MAWPRLLPHGEGAVGMVTARDREAWNSQKLVVLAHLKAGCSITQDEARG